MRDYQNLQVWKLAHQLLLDVYRATSAYPDVEKYTLTSQTRRSSLSIGSNLAEGSGRVAVGDFRRFVDYAYGSANELEYQLLVGRDLHYLPESAWSDLHGRVRRVQRMLAGLRRSLQ